ncbi:MAG: hypothetical protein CBB68_01150 [Rhodospirillaceae bacterium TMED8]|nr:peptidase M23 [Magnetovibrio sp.]OUT53285.1 MAG: hypothetical protein CBB68_01150 [Rhodospirillaceae bacterium TMED8]|tara:strand:- start:2675 stop:4036 length:1362 start_codon:yes stop_codon:yes gene_type:complete
MLFRGISIFAGIVAIMVTSSDYVLRNKGETHNTPEFDRDSLSLAPLSLGNPIVVPGIDMTSPTNHASNELANRQKKISHRVIFRSGDTLEKILLKMRVGQRDTQAAIKAFSANYNPRSIRSGDALKLSYLWHDHEDYESQLAPGIFSGFSYSVLNKEITVARDASGMFKSTTRPRAVSRRAVRAEGQISSSLYLAGKRHGVSDSALSELIRLFSWDIDFQREIRANDVFQVMFNHISDEDGKIVNIGEIIFAALTLSGKRSVIYRFTNDNDEIEYFDEVGQSAQKALMRTPIDGARLSSGYGKRKHPILGYTKMHKGVDFAAPKGTPIYAAGNGTIVYSGRKGAYGNYIRIRHNSGFFTAYAHMKGFARRVRPGRRVKQGQIIGYVGSTGRSTGPHLHYEILKKGRQINPMKVRMPPGRSLEGAELLRFHAIRREIDKNYALLKLLPLKTASR